jgi:hypothetical protein
MTPADFVKRKATPFDIWQRGCPYGKWTCADGREVLFNRAYRPIWERQNGVVKEANYGEWVPYVKSEYLFADDTSPWRQRSFGKTETLDRINAVMIEWGQQPLSPPPPLPGED